MRETVARHELTGRPGGSREEGKRPAAMYQPQRDKHKDHSHRSTRKASHEEQRRSEGEGRLGRGGRVTREKQTAAPALEDENRKSTLSSLDRLQCPKQSALSPTIRRPHVGSARREPWRAFLGGPRPRTTPAVPRKGNSGLRLTRTRSHNRGTLLVRLAHPQPRWGAHISQ